MNKNDKTIQNDVEILAEFIHIYCDDKHPDINKKPITASGPALRCLSGFSYSLCPDCARLLLHAVSKRIICPYDPKPACKKCETHCYAPGHRKKIREVMRYSGMRLIKRGRFGLIKKYFS